MKPFLSLQSVDEILLKIQAANPLGEEKVSLDKAVDRYLARDFFAPADLPGFDRSRVDGFAVRSSDIFGASETSPAFLELAPDCQMGSAVDFELRPGQASRILTGGMLPKGSDCAVMIEYSRPAGNEHVEITRSLAPGDNVVYGNEDAQSSALLIHKGKCLRPQEIGLLAAFGEENICVYRKPGAAVISTGDEIIPITANPLPGQIRDVNSHSLTALCAQVGVTMTNMGIVRDDPAQLQAIVDKALSQFDIVVVSGGSSAGMRDHTLDVFMGFPDACLLAHGAAISPGKPFILVKTGQKYLFGLPGHMTSALICAREFLLPLIRSLQGCAGEIPQAIIPAILERSVASAQGRRDYIRCRLENRDNICHALPLSATSAVISGMVEADGLIICPENLEGLKQGMDVKVEPFI